MRRWHSWVFRHKWGLAGWACVLAVALAFAWLTLKTREEARNSVCNGNLKMLSTSILSYQDRYGHFPPARIDSRDGTPMHSWRVLILTTQGLHPPVAFQYDFTQPWNGPSNSKLADSRYDFFACPSDPSTRTNRRLTNYFVVEGPQTPFPRSGTISIDDIKRGRGLANTIAVVESTGMNIEWLEPRDLTWDGMSFTVNDPGRPSVSSGHAHGPYVAMADGSIRPVAGIAPEVMEAMLRHESAWPP